MKRDLPSRAPAGTAFDSELVQPLPLPPAGRLTAATATAENLEDWTITVYEDTQGNLYERRRHPKWERWSLIVERAQAGQGIVYQAEGAPSDAVGQLNAWECFDDLLAAANALSHLVHDAQHRHLFPPRFDLLLGRLGFLVHEVNDTLEQFRGDAADPALPVQ